MVNDVCFQIGSQHWCASSPGETDGLLMTESTPSESSLAGTPEARRCSFWRELRLPGSGTNEVHFSLLVMADVDEIDTTKNYNIAVERIDPITSRYPYCIVWTPIPVLS